MWKNESNAEAAEGSQGENICLQSCLFPCQNSHGVLEIYRSEQLGDGQYLSLCTKVAGEGINLEEVVGCTSRSSPPLQEIATA